MTEARATFWARLAALAVLGLGVYVVVIPGVRDLNVHQNAYARRVETTIRTTINPGGRRTVQRTVTPSKDALVERTLGNGGLLLARLGIAALAAFIAGAVVQRTLLGQFAIKAAGLEIPAIGEAAAASAEAIKQRAVAMDAQRAVTADALKNAAEALRGVAALQRQTAGARPSGQE